MIEKKYKQIIDKLIEKSKSRQANWSQTSRVNEFSISFDTAVITTDKWSDDGIYRIDFAILNSQGDRIGQIYFEKSKNPEEYKILNELHTNAKESYYKVDETIENIFEQLNKEGKIGKE